MRITLLGTGSADGWPNPFCHCDSCDAERAEGRTRAPSAALVDDVVLIDCGPTAPQAIGAASRSLAAVEHVLVTHGHPDHLDPAFLLYRSWAGTSRALHVWAPVRAIEACRPWLAPDDDVELHVIAPGDVLRLATTVGDFTARVLPAAHASGNGDELAVEAVLFDLGDPSGTRLLYATDTGPLPRSTLEAIEGTFEAVIVEETFGDTCDHGTGHLDLSTLPALLENLRDRGAITPTTTIAATHLSHHNPPTRLLRQRVQPLGVQVLDDLSVIDTRLPAGRARTRHLVMGGARSGKSTFAERLAAHAPEVAYVATSGDRPGDADWAERVLEHRARRPAHWSTIETIDLVTAIGAARPDGVVLVDCLALWLTGQLDAADAWARADAGQAAEVRTEMTARIDEVAQAVSSSPSDLILVSNEVGMGVVPATASGRLFRDLLGVVNARAAAQCDYVTLVVAGRALPLEPSRPTRTAHLPTPPDDQPPRKARQ
jgi:adenosylcobinamide kinase/adenosylcobinamide-phosphate guanylyltransferase